MLRACARLISAFPLFLFFLTPTLHPDCSVVYCLIPSGVSKIQRDKSVTDRIGLRVRCGCVSFNLQFELIGLQ